MSTEDKKAFIRQRFEAAWNSNDLAALDELYSPDNIHHFGSTTDRLGPNEIRRMIKAWRDAIPDYRCSIENVVAEGDTVAGSSAIYRNPYVSAADGVISHGSTEEQTI